MDDYVSKPIGMEKNWRRYFGRDASRSKKAKRRGCFLSADRIVVCLRYLKRPWKKVAALPEDEQDAIASQILASTAKQDRMESRPCRKARCDPSNGTGSHREDEQTAAATGRCAMQVAHHAPVLAAVFPIFRLTLNVITQALLYPLPVQSSTSQSAVQEVRRREDQSAQFHQLGVPRLGGDE